MRRDGYVRLRRRRHDAPAAPTTERRRRRRDPQRGLGDILTAAFELYRANAAKLITIVAIVVIPLTFVLTLLTQVAFKQNCDTTNVQTIQDVQNVVNNCVGSAGRSLLVSAIGWFIAIAIQQLLLGALTRAGALATLGQPVDVDSSYR